MTQWSLRKDGSNKERKDKKWNLHFKSSGVMEIDQGKGTGICQQDVQAEPNIND